VERLSGANIGAGAPDVGDLLPEFQLPDSRGRLISSDTLFANGPVVLSLNRGHWCSFCRYELEALQAIANDVSRLDASIAAITPERQAFARQLKDWCHLEFPVLCDVDNGYALSLGLAVWCGAELEPLFTDLGIDLPHYQGNTGWIVPVPATFVVDRQGRIVTRYIDPDFRRRMEPANVLEALREI
jgi:peroxiredoxin